MGNNIKAQIGKNNTSGDGNNVNQIGYGNQNNSNNIVHNHYHQTNQNSSSDGNELILFGILITGVIIFMDYILFKDAYHISNIIKYTHAILALTPISLYNVYKKEALSKNNILKSLLILIIGVLSFICAKELFSMDDFKELANHAYNKKFLEYWDMKREWKVRSIYFFIGTTLVTLLLSINIFFTILFFKYSLTLEKVINLTGVIIIFLLAISIFYFIIFDKSILLNLINKIPLIK